MDILYPYHTWHALVREGNSKVQTSQFIMRRLLCAGPTALSLTADPTDILRFSAGRHFEPLRDDLALQRDKLCKQLCCCIWKLPKLQVRSLGKVRDHRRVNRIGLGTLASACAKKRTCAGL